MTEERPLAGPAVLDEFDLSGKELAVPDQPALLAASYVALEQLTRRR